MKYDDLLELRLPALINMVKQRVEAEITSDPVVLVLVYRLSELLNQFLNLIELSAKAAAEGMDAEIEEELKGIMLWLAEINGLVIRGDGVCH